MKKNIIIIPLFILAFILIFVITIVIFGFFGKTYIKKEAIEDVPETKIKISDKITLLNNGAVSEIELETYIASVVAAEMPASFELEALKAQAVAARTYTIHKGNTENAEHPNAKVCSDPAHCKAYISQDDMKTNLGENWMIEFYPKIVNAVNSTAGELITYNAQPISAVFHSTSSGITENSKDVWGGDLPYLVSVKSEGEEESPRYSDEVKFSLDEFKNKINSGSKKADFQKEQKIWVTDIKRNESNSVNTINICGTTFSGTEIRSLLGLRSTNFEIEISDNVVIKTKGNGHGVGLSQYGANHMAKMGYDYKDILKKYYTGVEIN